MRIKDSLKDLRRKELLENINKDLSEKFALKQNEYQIAGVLVIFNNLLQSLFKSQIKSLGFVMIGIFLMFWFLFRSLKLSCIGIIPNLIAALFILGFIGFLNIPLDMMTITIAAITIGIAVDNSIHYIYRYKKEFSISNDKNKAVEICHQTVGKAILSTSVTIIFGFSILILSNFNPTIYFGLFTGLILGISLSIFRDKLTGKVFNEQRLINLLPYKLLAILDLGNKKDSDLKLKFIFDNIYRGEMEREIAIIKIGFVDTLYSNYLKDFLTKEYGKVAITDDLSLSKEAYTQIPIFVLGAVKSNEVEEFIQQSKLQGNNFEGFLILKS